MIFVNNWRKLTCKHKLAKLFRLFNFDFKPHLHFTIDAVDSRGFEKQFRLIKYERNRININLAGSNTRAMNL